MKGQGRGLAREGQARALLKTRKIGKRVVEGRGLGIIQCTVAVLTEKDAS